MKNPIIVCLGDSLTAGYDLDRNLRWTDLLSTQLNASIINKGISGDTTGGMLSRFSSDVIMHHPAYVVIMGGTNDLSLDLDIETVLANIFAMTRQARFHNITPIIGIPTPYFPPKQDYSSEIFIQGDELAFRLHMLQDKLRRLVAEDSYEWIDFSKNLDRNHFLDDGLHPNAEGQKQMMENALRALTDMPMAF